jgi:hypothetical protein
MDSSYFLGWGDQLRQQLYAINIFSVLIFKLNPVSWVCPGWVALKY